MNPRTDTSGEWLHLRDESAWYISKTLGPPRNKEVWRACLLVMGPGRMDMSATFDALAAAKEGRCKVISVVALNAEQVHDYIDDQLLASDENTEVVTTFHKSSKRALEDAVWTLYGNTVGGDGPVFVYDGDSTLAIADQLRKWNLVGASAGQ